ncbi:MAG TPA: AI-2E family transporter [Polyangiales bacterium]|nr:AI-2E family transporter [Polyangiales bacterium]
MLWAVVVIAGCWLSIQLAPVVLALVLSLFLIGTLNPAVDWLERRHIRRSWGIPLVFMLVLLASVSLGALTLPTLFSQGRDLVEHEPQLRSKVVDFMSHTRILRPFAKSVHDFKWAPLAKAAAGSVWTASTTAAAYIGYFLSAIFLALYMMLDRDRLRGALFAMVPRDHHLRLSRILLKLETIVGGYIRGQALTSGLMAVFAFILLTVCGVPSALALAVFAGLADVLPYIGVVLSVGPMALAAATQSLVTAAIVVCVMLAYEEFESRYLIPRIYGQTLRLPSSMVLLALLVGGTLMGIIGALLALPLAAAIRMIVEELRVDLPGESVDDSPQRARDARAEREYAERSDGEPTAKAAAIAVEISKEQLERQDAAPKPVE